MATMAAGATPVDRRRRAYDMLDCAYPDRGYALRWCEQAQDMYKADGDMKEARLLLRSALGCRVAHYASVYKAWIAMELHAGNVINFEVWNGGADRARAVARAAAEAFPSDPTIYAKSLKVELLFRHGDRVLAHNLDNFAMNVDCKDWLLHYQVGACHGHDDSKTKQLGGGFFLGKMFRGIRRLVQYRRRQASLCRSIRPSRLVL
ncbi:hypothetical protein ACQ4PT_050051 [Festuca glaucescens]